MLARSGSQSLPLKNPRYANEIRAHNLAEDGGGEFPPKKKMPEINMYDVATLAILTL